VPVPSPICRRRTLATLLPGVFILPFFLFSATCGQIADKYDRALLARLSKQLEIVVMGLGSMGFRAASLPWLVTALFLMGLQSTLFGPVKYAYLPQHLRDGELVGGNGLVESAPFWPSWRTDLRRLAGVGGSSGRAGIAAWCSRWPWRAGGSAAASRCRRRPNRRCALNWNPLTATRDNLRFAARQPHRVAVAARHFVVLVLRRHAAGAVSGLSPATCWAAARAVFILLLTVFSLGMGAGSLACEKLSGGKVEIGLVPFGAIGLTLFGVDLFVASPDTDPPAALTADRRFHCAAPRTGACSPTSPLIGFFGGLYIVPLYALIQTRSERSHAVARDRRQQHPECRLHGGVGRREPAAVQGRLDIPQLFLATAVFNAVVALYIYTLVPEFLMRFIVWMLIHTVYRLQTKGPGAHTGRRTCRHRVQPRQLRRRAGHHRRLPAADPLRDGPPHLPHPAPELRVPHQPLHTRSPRQRKMRRCSNAPTNDIAACA
jgi:hypothetical protein